jgi:hypothetical protein
LESELRDLIYGALLEPERERNFVGRARSIIRGHFEVCPEKKNTLGDDFL